MAGDQYQIGERRAVATNCVTVFGGGIAGLTVAHELVERGFRVQLWEPRTDPRRPTRGAELGGMARTQWASVPWSAERSVAQVSARKNEWKDRRTQPISSLPQKFFLDHERHVVGALGTYGSTNTVRVAYEMFHALRDSPLIEHFYCEVFNLNVREKRETVSGEERKQFAAAIVEQMRVILRKVCDDIAIDDPQLVNPYSETMDAVVHITGGAYPRDIHVTIVDIDEYPDELPGALPIVIGFRVRERWLPGEHGFRFFPAFYHHVFDTMRRTPILEPVGKPTMAASQERSMTVNAIPDKYTESGRTVFDNLRSTTKLALGFGDGQWPAEFSRSLPRSFEELYSWIRISYEGGFGKHAVPRGLGFSARDTARFQLKIVQYLTSCEERRREYEELTWLEFLGGAESFSDNFATAISAWPEALIAMDANDVDARTHGSVLCQLILDNLRPTAYRDGTLNGPTSEAWINPWKRYLEAQGVEFIHGKLEGFRTVTAPDGSAVVWPSVSCYEPRYPDAEKNPPLAPGYFVLALSAQEARRVARSYCETVGAAHARHHPDLHALANQRAFGDGDDLDRPKPRGQLRHMVGVQYFFDEDVSWLDGHAYFPGSRWGISAISQVRFWQGKLDWEDGYRGILSVVISIFDEPSDSTHQLAFDTAPDRLAEEIWRQIRSSTGVERPIPEPRYWHIDDDFRWTPDPEKPGVARYKNFSPYQINLAGSWQERPGDLDAEPGSRYSAFDGIVCAGTHMKTFTRLTTMEAANESARHAVNAILEKCGQETRRSRCEIWPLEEREVVDLQLAKEVDAELYARGADHFMNILGLDELVTHGLRGGQSDLLNPITALEKLSRLFGRFRSELEVHGPGEDY